MQLQLFDNLHGEILRVSQVIPSSQLQEGDTLHFTLNYTGSSIRLIVKNQNGEVIWDTQELEIKAKMQPYSLNQFGFEVRKWDPWHVTKSIAWVPEGYIKLYDKIYRGEAELYIDNATVYVKGIGYIENNDYFSDPGLIPIEEDGEEYYLLQQETS